MASRMSNLVDS